MRAFAELFRLWRNLDTELQNDPRARRALAAASRPTECAPRANEFRSEPPAAREAAEGPVNYRVGMQLVERLQGLGIVVLGLLGLLVVYGLIPGCCRRACRRRRSRPACSSRCRPINATACFTPLMAITSVLLIVVGFRRVLDP